jgi:hypothetical protein
MRKALIFYLFVAVLESVLQDKDKALPKDLLDKFSPLKCDLCNAKVSSHPNCNQFAQSKILLDEFKFHGKTSLQWQEPRKEGAPVYEQFEWRRSSLLCTEEG